MEHTPPFPIICGGTNNNTSNGGINEILTVSLADEVRRVVEEELLSANVIISNFNQSHCEIHSTGASQRQRMDIEEDMGNGTKTSATVCLTIGHERTTYVDPNGQNRTQIGQRK